MAAFVLTDTSIYAGPLDASCFGDTVALDVAGNVIRKTTFCDGGWESYVPGLRQWTASWSGPQDLAATAASATHTPDEAVAAAGGVLTAWPLLIVPVGAAEGAAAYGGNAMLASYSPWTGAVGALARHNVVAGPWLDSPLVRGVFATKQTVTATGNGTGHQVGAVTSAQRVWAGVHFLTAGGTTPSCTVILESDDNAGFTSPTTRITFTAATARGAQWSSLAGAITDTYWRFRWTVSGTLPSFQIRGFVGIQ